MWLQRHLSIQGRVLLSKAEGISRSVYVSLSLDIPPEVTRQLDKMLFDFIWKNKKFTEVQKQSRMMTHFMPECDAGVGLGSPYHKKRLHASVRAQTIPLFQASVSLEVSEQNAPLLRAEIQTLLAKHQWK